MAGSLSSRVEISNGAEITLVGAAFFDFHDCNGLMTTVGHKDEPPRFVKTETPASIEFFRKGIRDGSNGLDQCESRLSLKAFKALSVFGSDIDSFDKVSVYTEYGHLSQQRTNNIY